MNTDLIPQGLSAGGGIGEAAFADDLESKLPILRGISVGGWVVVR